MMTNVKIEGIHVVGVHLFVGNNQVVKPKDCQTTTTIINKQRQILCFYLLF